MKRNNLRFKNYTCMSILILSFKTCVRFIVTYTNTIVDVTASNLNENITNTEGDYSFIFFFMFSVNIISIFIPRFHFKRYNFGKHQFQKCCIYSYSLWHVKVNMTINIVLSYFSHLLDNLANRKD